MRLDRLRDLAILSRCVCLLLLLARGGVAESGPSFDDHIGRIDITASLQRDFRVSMRKNCKNFLIARTKARKVNY
jgi:hypothetical protein